MFKIFKILLLMLWLFPAVVFSSPSLKEKIAQMIVVGFKGTSISDTDWVMEAIANHEIGGVVLFDYDFQSKKYERNILNPKQLHELTTTLQQKQWIATKDNRALHYPLIISIDYEGGKVNRLKEKYGFPPTIAAAKLGLLSDEKVKLSALSMANTLKKVGINSNYAPVLDLNLNSDNPVIAQVERSFSKSTAIVTKKAIIFSDSYYRNSIACVYKHFPGHGSSSSDTHKGLVDVTHSWQAIELDPYREIFKYPKHCPMVMTAHIVNRQLDPTGLPASLSHEITQGLLRDKLKFDGVIVTDDLQMKAISDHYGLSETIILAIKAGADLLLFGNQLVEKPVYPAEIIKIIETAILQKKLSEKDINLTYHRIMTMRKKLSFNIVKE